MTLKAGQKLAHYEILEPIGSGGMGDVYRARDTRLGRDVAIKALPSDVTASKERLARFEREAHLLASLNHPGIATLHGLEPTDAGPLLVMELVEGETLAERLTRGPLELHEALGLFQQIAEALESAHARGILHRDLKPANVMITTEGRAKVLDFGLAKAFLEDEPEAGASHSPTLTKGTALGVILGTAAYMSPEQARGKRVDQRTDVWAFGAVLYEALTGRKAFEAETVTDILAAVVRAEPDWSVLPRETPRRVRDLLERCLRKDLRHRVQHIGDARIAVEEARATDEVVAGAPPRSAPYWLTGAAVLVTAALTWMLARPEPVPSDMVSRSVLPLAPGTHLARNGIAANIAIAPDGRQVAYVAEDDSGRRLYLRSLAELEARPIPSSEEARMPFFSPDGNWVDFRQGARLMKVPVSGGAPALLADITPNARGASWSDDDRIVLTISNTGGLSWDGGRRGFTH